MLLCDFILYFFFLFFPGDHIKSVSTKFAENNGDSFSNMGLSSTDRIITEEYKVRLDKLFPIYNIK